MTRSSPATGLFVASLLDITDNIVGRRARAAARRRPLRRRRPLPRRRRRQGHGDLLRHRQRDLRRARLLARRRLRLRRLPRLRPQGAWASPRAAPGSRSSATSASCGRTSWHRISPSSASATCPVTCSATGCCCRRRSTLIGAFNHSHVFLDPDPDADSQPRGAPAAVRAARVVMGRLRRRAASQPAAAYSSAAPSRSPLSRRCARASRSRSRALTPDEVIRALLRAPVDLLWNGGIGTYVKAAAETHARRRRQGQRRGARRRRELRCRVVGEGGNLGLTQRGRVEYARAGGRVNTDAIDNAGGVNCSDREVNIKILLDAVVRDGDADAKPARRATRGDDRRGRRAGAARQLHAEPGAQPRRGPGAGRCSTSTLRMIRYLEQNAGFNRALEALPGDEEIAERRLREEGLTSPELAVLLAHAKISLNAALVDSDLPEDPYLAGELDRYFPRPLPERFPAQMRRHRLRREIITTHVTNDYVDNAGISSAFRLIEETGAHPSDLARAYIVAREAFGLRRSGTRSRRSTTSPTRRRRSRCCSRRAGWSSGRRAGWCATAPRRSTSHRRSSLRARSRRAGRGAARCARGLRPRNLRRVARELLPARRAGAPRPARGVDAGVARSARRRRGGRRRGPPTRARDRRVLSHRRIASRCTGFATA